MVGEECCLASFSGSSLSGTEENDKHLPRLTTGVFHLTLPLLKSESESKNFLNSQFKALKSYRSTLFVNEAMGK